MKKTFKRLFALILSALLIVGAFSETAFAAKKTVTYYNFSGSKSYKYIDGKWVIDMEQSYSYKKNGDTKSYSYCFYD